jgi:hypothetical protein
MVSYPNSLTPLKTPFDLASYINFVTPLATIRKRKGDNGKPYLSPIEAMKKIKGGPLMIIYNETD